MTFRPMGHRLTNVLAQNLNGEFEERLELNPQFAASLDAAAVEPEDTAEEFHDREVE